MSYLTPALYFNRRGDETLLCILGDIAKSVLGAHFNLIKSIIIFQQKLALPEKLKKVKMII